MPSGHQSCTETSPSRSSPSSVTLAGLEVPDRRARVALALVVEGEPLVAGDGRPALRGQRHSLVELVADGRAGSRIEDAERRVDEVAVLGVLEAEQRAVRGEAAAQEALASTPPSAPIGRRGAGSAAPVRRPATRRRRSRRDPRSPRRRFPEPARAPRSSRAERPRGSARLASGERLHEPACPTRRRVSSWNQSTPSPSSVGARRSGRPGGRSPAVARRSRCPACAPARRRTRSRRRRRVAGRRRPLRQIRDGRAKALLPGRRIIGARLPA